MVWRDRLMNLVAIFAILLFISLVGSRIFLWEPFNAPSGSMRPSVMTGDYFLVSKSAYGYSRYSFPLAMFPFEGRVWEGPVERGDIAVFRRPPENNIDYIKRIIGMPGDRIQMWEGILHINGKAVERERMEDFADDRGGKVIQYIETLPNGRRHGILEALGDEGHLDNTVEFEVPEGHYFAMGDNRDNSADSRIFGFIPADNLIGKLGVVFWRGSERRLTWLTPD